VCRLLLLLSVTTWWHSCLPEPAQEAQEDMSRELPISSVYPERERTTARACKVVSGALGMKASRPPRRCGHALLMPPWSLCLQKWREMRLYSRLFCPWLMSWGQAITRRSARTSRQAHAWWLSVMGSGLCASLAIHHLGAEPTIVLGHQSEQMALTSTGTSLRHPVL
jgi:hypothetical protein